MPEILNEDEFSDEPKRRAYFVHGSQGWTDAFDLDTIELLIQIGAIRQVQVSSAAGWEVTFYDTVSRYPT